MQFKLYNFHKFVGDFANSLVGTFVPLLIYKATGILRLSLLFLVGQGLCRVASNHLFKKLFNNYPQLTLLIRMIPLLIYNVMLLFIDEFLIGSIIIIAIAYGVNQSLKNNASAIILNYSSRKRSSKNIATNRTVEHISCLIAAVTGGLFMDWNPTLLIIFSMGLYLISVIPLIIFAIINRNKRGFNKDFTSNVAVVYDKTPELKVKRKKLVKTFVLQYFMFYAIFCVIDYFTSMFSLHLFISAPTFTQAGYITAVFQLANVVSVLSVQAISKRLDIKVANLICGIVCAIPLGLIPFVRNHLLIYILVFVFGYTYAICSYYMVDSLMTKCKIISANNKALIARQDGIMVGQSTSVIIGIIFNSVIPVFFAMVIALVIYAIYTYIVEERLRRQLVDYIENNEIK